MIFGYIVTNEKKLLYTTIYVIAFIYRYVQVYFDLISYYIHLSILSNYDLRYFCDKQVTTIFA